MNTVWIRVSFSLAPNLPVQSILEHSVKPNISEAPRALVVSGTA